MTLVLDTNNGNPCTVSSTNYIAFSPQANAGFSFDNVRVLSNSLSNTTTYEYNAGNELTKSTTGSVDTTFTYDSWGRLITKQMPGHSATYTWGYGDKLVAVSTNFPEETSASYIYDGLGARRAQVINGATTWYRYGAGGTQLNEYKDTDTDWVVEAQNGDPAKWSYVPGLARIAGGDLSSGAYQYQLRDRLGSVRDIRSQAKARLAEYTFEPYGDVWSASGLALNQGFTGHTWDAALGMYHTAYRHYSPGMARWMSRDPLGMVDGPNLYGYVGGDPVNGTDPWGLSELPFYAPTEWLTGPGGFAGGLCFPCFAPAIGALVGGAAAVAAGASAILTAPVSVPVIIGGVVVAAGVGALAGLHFQAKEKKKTRKSGKDRANDLGDGDRDVINSNDPPRPGEKPSKYADRLFPDGPKGQGTPHSRVRKWCSRR